jgi:hypothetical protein
LRAYSLGYHQPLVIIFEGLIILDIMHSLSRSNEQSFSHKAKEWPNSSNKCFMFCNLFKNSIVLHLFFIKFDLGLWILFSTTQTSFWKPIPNNTFFSQVIILNFSSHPKPLFLRIVPIILHMFLTVHNMVRYKFNFEILANWLCNSCKSHKFECVQRLISFSNPIHVVFLCTKISIIKLPLTIVRILVGYDYIDGVEPQGLCRRCYQAFRD